MKKNLNLNKLIAMAVLLGGVSYGFSAWAEGTTIKIGIAGNNPNTYSTTTGVGVDAENTNRVLGTAVDKIVTWDGSTEGGAIDVFTGVYGIKAVLSSSVTSDSILDGINVYCSNHDVWGIYLASSGTNTISDLGSIDVKEDGAGYAKGIEISAGTNTITFTGGTSYIDVKNAGNWVKKYGIHLTGGTNYIGTDAQSAIEHELGSVTVGGTGSGSAYGIIAAGGKNTLFFAGSNSSIAVTSSSSAYGIGFFNVGPKGAGPATGTTTIKGLGSVMATSTGSEAAYGIYAKNGNSVGDIATFSVSFDTANNTIGGSISAYSATGENYGVKFDENNGNTGKSEVLNVKTIVAGVDPDNNVNISSGTAYGVYAVAGVNTVTFAGTNKSITAKSGNNAYGIYLEGGNNYIGTDSNNTTGVELGSIAAEVTGTGDERTAYGINVYAGENTIKFSGVGSSITATCGGDSAGIFLANGATTITGLGSITVVSTEGDTYGIYTAEGTNEISFKGNGGQAIKSTVGVAGEAYSICVIADADSGETSTNNTTVNFENTVLSGKIYQGVADNGGVENSNLTLNFNNGGVWTPKTGDITGTITLNVNSGGKIVFDLPVATVAGDTILQMNGTVAISDGSKIQVINGKATSLQEGDEICLIENNAAITLDSNVTKQHSTNGITWSDAEIYLNATDSKKLMYKMGKMGLDPDGSKAPAEGMAAAALTVNAGSDLATGAGLSNLQTRTAEVNGTETFGAANYGKSINKTGSSVDMSGYNLMVGVGRRVFDSKGNKTTGGLYFEYGNSNFDSYNTGYNGTGKNIYKGAGYLMRWDNKSGNYYEGMVHAGKITTNWSNKSGGYNVAPTYYGGVITYGHKFMVGENKQLSVYGGYIYNHIGGGDAKIGDYNYNFEATKSSRTKVGVRYAMSDLMDTGKFRPYVGLAWEHEFNGESGASVEGFGRTLAPSMKGDSGILELGCKQEVGKWTFGIGAELFTGKRRGWNGTLQAVYSF